MNSILFTKLNRERWFVWTLVFLFVVGVGLISYIQYVNYEMDTVNVLMLAAV